MHMTSKNCRIRLRGIAVNPLRSSSFSAWTLCLALELFVHVLETVLDVTRHLQAFVSGVESTIRD